jgi:hypothetical protein
VTRALVVIPTYNERDTLPRVVAGVLAAPVDVDVLVVDDNSPDGTGQIADDLAANDQHVHVMHRPGKEPAWGRRTGPGWAGAWSRATTCWWRWTPTCPTTRSTCPTWWRAPPPPTWCWAAATCPAGEHEKLAVAPACPVLRGQPVRAQRDGGAWCMTAPPGTARSGARCWRRSTWPRAAIRWLQLPAGDAAAGLACRVRDRRGPHRVRGADPRHIQDLPGDRAGSTVAGPALGGERSTSRSRRPASAVRGSVRRVQG